MDSFHVVIPGDIEECCWPNSRCHWAQKASQVKTLRYTSKLLTTIALDRDQPSLRVDPGQCIKVRWHHVLGKYKKQRDIDNTIAACKPIQDGVFDALGLNDRLVRMVEVTWSRGLTSQTEMTVEVTCL